MKLIKFINVNYVKNISLHTSTYLQRHLKQVHGPMKKWHFCDLCDESLTLFFSLLEIIVREIYAKIDNLRRGLLCGL